MERKIFFIIFSAISISLLLGACSEPDLEGTILEASEEKLLFSEGMTPNEYEKVRELAWDELMEESIPLITLTYTGKETFQEGDYVNVWIEGDILMSYPGQARSSKIQLKE